jgi:hypothetical protein
MYVSHKLVADLERGFLEARGGMQRGMQRTEFQLACSNQAHVYVKCSSPVSE